MQKILFVLLLISIFIPIIVLIIKHIIDQNSKKYKESCTTNADCGTNKVCVFDSDLNKNICTNSQNKICGITPNIDLKSCNPLNPDDKNFFNCKENCLNSLPWSCRNVTWGKLNMIKPGSKYTVGNVNGTGDNKSIGTDMVLNITKVDVNGQILTITIINPGKNFKPNDNVILTQLKSKNDGIVNLTKDFNPYIWENTDGGNIIIPETKNGWCLPNITKQSSTCNIFTSNTVLRKNGKDSYSWGCECRNPSMFDHSGPGESSCDNNLTCSGKENGLLYVPYVDPVKQAVEPCNTNESCGPDKLCCKPGWPDPTQKGSCLSNTEVSNDSENICHISWNKQKNSDPREGICDCNTGLKFTEYISSPSNFNKLCVTDSCANNGGTLSGVSCQCPDPYVSCGGADAVVKNQVCNDPICVKDVCWPYGKFDGNTCVCFPDQQSVDKLNKGISDPVNHYIYDSNCVVVPDNNWANTSTKILCGKGNPCSGTLDAKCVVLNQGGSSSPTSYKFEVCTNCPCPECNPPFCDNKKYTTKTDCTNNNGTWYDSSPYANPNCTGGIGPYCTGIDDTRGKSGDQCGDGTKIPYNGGCCPGLNCEANQYSHENMCLSN